jgi:hypothetical protein
LGYSTFSGRVGRARRGAARASIFELPISPLLILLLDEVCFLFEHNIE